MQVIVRKIYNGYVFAALRTFDLYHILDKLLLT